MKHGFIGCGNMGGAIATALSKITKDFVVTDRSGNACTLASKLGCAYGDNLLAASSCDRLFLAVKPQMMADVLAPLQEVLAKKKPLRITMAAGLTMVKIQELAGCELPVIRIMPNTPVAIGSGMTLYCCNHLVSKEVLSDFLQDMMYTGRLDQVPEH